MTVHVQVAILLQNQVLPVPFLTPAAGGAANPDTINSFADAVNPEAFNPNALAAPVPEGAPAEPFVQAFNTAPRLAPLDAGLRFADFQPVLGIPHMYRVTARWGYMEVVDQGAAFKKALVAYIRGCVEARWPAGHTHVSAPALLHACDQPWCSGAAMVRDAQPIGGLEVT